MDDDDDKIVKLVPTAGGGGPSDPSKELDRVERNQKVRDEIVVGLRKQVFTVDEETGIQSVTTDEDTVKLMLRTLKDSDATDLRARQLGIEEKDVDTRREVWDITRRIGSLMEESLYKDSGRPLTPEEVEAKMPKGRLSSKPVGSHETEAAGEILAGEDVESFMARVEPLMEKYHSVDDDDGKDGGGGDE